MYRMKQLLGDSLTLRDYDGQVAEAMAMVRALNRMTKAGMPESVRIAWKSSQLQGRSHEILFIQQSPVRSIGGGAALFFAWWVSICLKKNRVCLYGINARKESIYPDWSRAGSDSEQAIAEEQP